jgi:hypothetical protein
MAVQITAYFGMSAPPQLLGSSTTFAGNILAISSITLNTSARILCGRALAETGAVTLDTNAISNDCVGANFDSGRSDFGSVGFSGGGVQAVPEPGTAALLGMGLLLGLTLHVRKSLAASRALSRNC